MSLIQGQGTDPQRQQSPPVSAGLALPSNNPFRNRAASPANSLPSPVGNGFTIPSTAPERPVSRNPFLDQSDKKGLAATRVRSLSPPKGVAAMDGTATAKPGFLPHAEELFDNLNLIDGPSTNGANPPPYSSRQLRSENVPPKPSNGLSIHHSSRSGENRPQRQLPNGLGPAPRQALDIFADPPDQSKLRHRLRRNSDSSIASRLLSPEEEQRRRERHRKEREARHRERKERPPGASKSKKPQKRLDVIDSLDVTSIYGTGLFHHDGPFDACNPDRNRKGARRAPMQAFAKDSANNTMGGSGPVNKDINFNQFHGRGAEGFTDYSTSGAKNPVVDQTEYEPYAGSSALNRGPTIRPGIDRSASFNPIARGDPLHGEETMGLGTSTFLDGAPAARAVIQRRESETEVATVDGGLGRKRSLAQKIRGISNARGERTFRPAGRITSPDGALERTTSPTSPGEVQSAGGMPKIQESNPFFNDYDDAYEKKGAKIQIAEDKNRIGSVGGGGDEAFTVAGRERAVSSPKRMPASGLLERRVTNDGTGVNGESSAPIGGGFLNRVKSLKGGKRSRPERAL